MKLKRNQLLFMILVAGFLFGSIYVSKSGVKGTIFDSETIELFCIHEIDYRKYLFYIIRERLGLLFIVIFLGNVRWNKIYGGILTFIIGITGGMVLTMAAMQAGLHGGIVCLLCLLPHTVFYGLVYGVLVNCWTGDGRWNRSRVFGIVVFMTLGIISEVYVNPSIVKIFMR